MGRSRDYLPFQRGSTATAGDTLIVNQLGSMSAIDALAGQTNPAASTAIPAAGVGGPGQLPTTALPYQPYRNDLAGYIGDATDNIVLGFGTHIMLRAVQYIPTSGSAYLALDGHALAVSATMGWGQIVCTGPQGTSGKQSWLPDPAYFMGRSIPVYVKPYDWFFVVEEGPAVGIITGTVAGQASVMSNGSGLLTAATATSYAIGTTDGNNGNTVSTTQYGYGCYTVPSGITFSAGSVNTTTGVGTAGTVLAGAFAPTPSGVTLNPYTGAGVATNWMSSGATNNTSNYVLLYVRPFLQMPEA